MAVRKYSSFPMCNVLISAKQHGAWRGHPTNLGSSPNSALASSEFPESHFNSLNLKFLTCKMSGHCPVGGDLTGDRARFMSWASTWLFWTANFSSTGCNDSNLDELLRKLYKLKFVNHQTYRRHLHKQTNKQTNVIAFFISYSAGFLGSRNEMMYMKIHNNAWHIVEAICCACCGTSPRSPNKTSVVIAKSSQLSSPLGIVLS